jgi:hypothetical protein
MEENSELVELLEDVLGKCGLHYPNRGQISFNCPICDEGRNIILKLIISIMFTSVGHVVMLITHMVVLKEYSIDMLITNKKSYLEFSNLKPLK